MPRQKSYDRTALIADAMSRFWRYGYAGSSMDDLVKATGVSRHGLYSEFGGKHALFLAVVAAYQTAVVSPAFAAVEAPGAGFAAIEAYFETQIARAEALDETFGPNPPGCLIANAMTETGPHDPAVRSAIRAHQRRLTAGFRNALGGEISDTRISDADLDALAAFLAISAQGLWSATRAMDDLADARAYAATLLALVRERLSR